MRSASILIIGDDPAARRLLRTALSAQGFEIDDAANGGDALGRLRKEPPDIILLDLKGGAMDTAW